MGTPTRKKPYDHRLRVSILFGLFEADATGVVAIGAALLFLMLAGAGRWCGLW